jgi:hypothetical protein
MAGLRVPAWRRRGNPREEHPWKQPTIARIWRGRTRRDRADEYEAYNYDAGIRPLIKLALGVQTFREDLENETEFMTISLLGEHRVDQRVHVQRPVRGPSFGAG